jgi:hypothetical protein
MARTVKSSGLGLAFVVMALFGVWPSASGASFGNLQGIVQDEAGQPLANILVALVEKSTEQAIPILARTNASGRLFVSRIEPGAYQLNVKSAGYRTAGLGSVQVDPGKTAVVKLVLQELLNAEGDDQGNVGLKSLLRTSTARRMIFRDKPDETESSFAANSPFDNLVVQVYTNAGTRDDYVVFPADSSQGASTNFAFVDSFLGNNKYIFAGQLNSGENSLWRLKNIYQYDIGEIQSVQFFLGYGRMSFQQPRLALLGNPIAIGNEVDYVRASGNTRMLDLGFEDRLRFGDSLSVIWGLEVNQVSNLRSDSFINPNARISYSPTSGTTVELIASSRRPSQANLVTLPDGESVNLDDSLHFARVGDRLTYGASRYYQASVAQRLGGSSEVEVAHFTSRRFGGALPFFAVLEGQSETEALQLEDEQAGTQGFRFSWRQRLSPCVKTSVSYLRANALGLPASRVTALVFDAAGMDSVFSRQQFNGFAAQVDAVIPRTQTTITGLLKVLADGRPMTTIDPYSDVYETGNDGVNLFIRQVIPVPTAFLNFVGLDFLAQPQIEALLDLRNVVNQNLGVLETPQGDVVLLRAPRSVRGGIALKF